MRYLFYMGHPAHFHLFKNIILNLKDKGHEVRLLIKKKDILEELLQRMGWEYTNINPKGRADNKISIAWNLLKRDLEMFRIARRFKPNAMMGTSAEISHTGTLLGIPSIVFDEDDADAIPLFSKLAHPLATRILAPRCTRMGKWEKKKSGYEGYHELAYLHPDYFTPDASVISELKPEEKYFVIRFSRLGAHHDSGVTGISDELALKICEILRPHGRIFISSERDLGPALEPYRIKLNPLSIHHVLYYAQLVICDSQTMSAEAGVLGTPFIRYNDFVDRLSYLEELEKTYGLGFGIKPPNDEQLLNKVSELASAEGMKEEWQKRRNKMLAEKIDLVQFATQVILETSKK